jgi:hypothetical protein
MPDSPVLTQEISRTRDRLRDMVRLACPVCGNEVFFDSMRCVRCHTELAYELSPGGHLVARDAGSVGACMRREEWRCNWRPDPMAGTPALCPSCLVVDAGDHLPTRLLAAFLTAQRRALWQLTELGVAWAPDPTLRFTYRSGSAGDAAVSATSAG